MKKRLLLSIFVLLLFIPVSYASADTPAPGGPFSTTLTLRNKESYQVSCVFTVYQNDGWVVFNSNEIILTVNDWEYVNVPDLALDQGAGYSVVVNCSGNVAISQNFADLDSGASFRGSTPSTSWYLPGLYDNYYNYYSTVFVQNAVGTDISATLQVYPSGSTTPVYQETRTIKAYESESFQLEGKGELIQNQTYSGKVTSTGNSLSIVSTYGRSSANNQLYAYNGFTAGSGTFYAPVVRCLH